MAIIGRTAEQKGYVLGDNMTQIEVQTCYIAGESAITVLIPSNTPKDRMRNVSMLKMSTLVRLLQKSKKGQG